MKIIKKFFPLIKRAMCDKSKCCQCILRIYPETYRYFEYVNPQNIDLTSLLSCLQLYLTPVYEATKTGKVFCCQGIVDAINKTVRTYIKSDPEDAGNFYATMNQILIQAGFSIPTTSLTIKKILNPVDDPGRFIYYLNDKPVGPANGISDGGSIFLDNLPLGNYSVTEAGAPGTNINDYIVLNSINSGSIDPGLVSNFTLNCGSPTICEFFNERPGVPPCRGSKFYGGSINLPIGDTGSVWSPFPSDSGIIECYGEKITPPSLLTSWGPAPSNEVQYSMESESELNISMIVPGYIVQVVQAQNIGNEYSCIKTKYKYNSTKSVSLDVSETVEIFIWYYSCSS